MIELSQIHEAKPGKIILVRGKSPEAVAKEILTNRIIDITNGFPSENSKQLWQTYLHLFRQGLSRIPIIGTQNDQVYAWSDPRDIRHLALWQALGQPSVSFTTSLEGFRFEQPQGLHLKLETETPAKVFIPLGLGTDHAAFFPKHPLSKLLTQEGLGKMEQIFNIEGVTFQQ